ncbi:MAG: L-rhamnose/proton symporter RhaT [Terriglobales bacterium]|jgi:L-rhamnose-H+ transport protein
MDQAGVGFLILLVAGVMNASFTLPMKFTRNWSWENTWLVWTLFALVIFPPLAAFATIPHLAKLYGEVATTLVITVAVFGAGWGIAQVLFGLAVDSIGIALTFSIVLGISAAVGSVIPLVRLHPEKLLATSGLFTFAGVALVIVGVTICAIAGRRREHILAASEGRPRSNMSRGLACAILCGFGAALVNFGLAFGGPLLDAARRHGAADVWAGNAVWLPLMLAGSIPNFAYCVYLLGKNKTTDRYGRPGTAHYWLLAAIMAFFWFASTALYGIATGKLGSWGTILGWPLFMSLIVITASILGFATGEWNGSGKQPLRIQAAGVVVLVLAVFVLASASRWV